jgi:hypothetical protein
VQDLGFHPQFWEKKVKRRRRLPTNVERKYLSNDYFVGPKVSSLNEVNLNNQSVMPATLLPFISNL